MLETIGICVGGLVLISCAVLFVGLAWRTHVHDIAMIDQLVARNQIERDTHRADMHELTNKVIAKSFDEYERLRSERVRIGFDHPDNPEQVEEPIEEIGPDAEPI